MSAVDVVAVLSPGERQIVESTQWRYDRTTLRDCPDIDVSNEVHLLRHSKKVHHYETTLRSVDEKPRIALIDADKLAEARAAVAELIAFVREVECVTDGTRRLEYVRVKNLNDKARAALARCKGEATP